MQFLKNFKHSELSQDTSTNDLQYHLTLQDAHYMNPETCAEHLETLRTVI